MVLLKMTLEIFTINVKNLCTLESSMMLIFQNKYMVS